jgi:hypothetical protein
MTDDSSEFAWGVEYRGPNGPTVHLSYDRNGSKEEAIRAFEEYIGKPWSECVADGAALVRQKIHRKP